MFRFMASLSLVLLCAVSHARSLEMYWIDVEGGAATLIVTPAGESILIDSGNPGQRDPQRIFKVATEQAKLRRIDHLITTHYHRDHFGGASTLAKLMPIGIVYDNGKFDDMPDDPGPDYWNFPCAARKVVNPGDVVTLQQINGKSISLTCLGTRKTFTDSDDVDENENVCATHRPKDRDGSDNANSVAMLLEYEGFRFLDNGDLTWNQEYKLVCPRNQIGEVDVYQVTHHGLDASNNPVVLNSVKPTVSVMNNGTTKGCAPEVFANLQACTSIKAMYQVHKNVRPDGNVNNAPDEYIANRKADECDANFIKLVVAESGQEYTVSIAANEHARTFQTKAASADVDSATSETKTSAGKTSHNSALQQRPGSQHDRQVLLWPNGAPNAKGDDPTDKPALTIHLPASDVANGAAMIVNPGGGYSVLAADHEGLQVARELNRQGIAAFVLRYRLKPSYDVDNALADAQRAVRYVRAHASEFDIDPQRIGMIGFSAGGHLASNVGTTFDSGDAEHDDVVERVSCRPDFLALIYPAIAGELFDKPRDYPATHTRVTSETPPTFFAHTHEDSLSPNHSVYFYQQLLKQNVPAELHIFGFGPHGTGLAPGDPDLGQWPTLLTNWMRRSGFLTGSQRKSMQGEVRVEGQPLYWGWLTLIPDDPHSPTVTSYLGWDRQGKFEIDASHGPVPGTYRVEVRRVATDFSDKTSGAYSISDAELFDQFDGNPVKIEITSGVNVDFVIDVGN